MKYPKSHPLWPVYDLQRQIIKRGGKINRNSDLLAYFEGRSLESDSNAIDTLFSLASLNSKSFSSNAYEATKDLIDYEFLIYRDKNSGIGFNTDRIKCGDKKTPGFSYSIPDYMKNEEYRSKKGYLIKDNEFALRKSDFTGVVIINEKYIDIFRIIFNGYTLRNENQMKNNKNLLPALIIAVGLIIAALIYAFSTRYHYENYLIIDKWNGTYKQIEKTKK